MSKYFDREKLSGYEESPITYVYVENLEEFHKKITDLQSKLAEKEKEVEKLKIILNMQAVQASEEQRLSIINTDCVQYNQNQKAIEQLDKVRETINDKYQYLSKLEQQGELTYYGEGAQSLCCLLLTQIDQQINELKGK